jgi:hypothetical protein
VATNVGDFVEKSVQHFKKGTCNPRVATNLDDFVENLCNIMRKAHATLCNILRKVHETVHWQTLYNNFSQNFVRFAKFTK